jgi:hypothetical protein
MPLDSKFLITLIGIVVTVLAICNTNISPYTSEGFWGNSVARKCMKTSFKSTNGHKKFVSYPSYQNDLSPRISNTGYGSRIDYNPPNYENLGVPSHPLAFSDMARQNYETLGNLGCDNNISNNNLEEPDNIKDIDNDSLPVGDMTTFDSEGPDNQPIIYDRIICSNQSSRLRQNGCVIRGDIPITPISRGWMDIHPNANDIQLGAMNIMGGVDNENSKNLARHQLQLSGGTQTISGGIDMYPDGGNKINVHHSLR